MMIALSLALPNALGTGVPSGAMYRIVNGQKVYAYSPSRQALAVRK